MKGLLKSKSPGSQFVLLISIALVSLFLFGYLGMIILSSITGMDLKELADSSKWDYSKPAVITLIRGLQAVQFIGLFLIPSLVCARLFSTDMKSYLGLKKPSNLFYFGAGAIAIIVAIPLVTYLGQLNQQVQFPGAIEKWMKASEEDAARTTRSLLSRHTINDLILNVVFIAGLAAVGEELLFRGMAQRLLIKMFKSHWAGIIVAAILFSAMHMQFYGFLPRFALGILLGIIYWYSGSLWTAIFAHFIYDGLLIVLVYFKPTMMNDDQAVELNSLALMGSISFVLVVLFIEWMRRKTKTTYNSVYADDSIPVKNHPFDFE